MKTRGSRRLCARGLWLSSLTLVAMSGCSDGKPTERLPHAERLTKAPAPYISPPVTPYRVTGNPSALIVSTTPARKHVPEGEPLPTEPPKKKAPKSDPSAQLSTTQQGDLPDTIDALSNPIVNVAGINSNAAPPDTVGDIGRSHYVQMTNAAATGGQTVFQVFSKAGAALTGALRFGGLWPAGDPCNSDLGDPIVVYDHLADRWLLSQFARNAAQTQFWECVAISQTPDPTNNTWFLYTFETPEFPDYGKVGVWPDGYYLSTFEEPDLGAYVFDRANMLLGNAASFARFTINALGTASVRSTRILPADLDGAAPPPGTPNPFVRTVDDQQDTGNPTDRIEIYEFAADWVSNTFSFNLATTLAAADGLVAFDTMTCNRNGQGVRDCIPQPDDVDTVDALSNRPMMQLKYRRFGSESAMVFNQTIDIAGSINGLLGFTPAGEVAGVRWYELRRPDAGAWGIRQQGTYAPQPNGATLEAQLLHRWMGSAAIDRNGNIALGFSIVNSNSTNGQEVYPGLRYTGRLVGDPAGVMAQGEKTIVNGANAQGDGDTNVTPQRWGDYSALSVDPIDDCTFWFTSHTADAPGTGAKPTRIASFRMSDCGTDLSITKADTPDPIVAGAQLRYDLTVKNNGSAAAPNVVVSDQLDPDVTFLSSTTPCALAGGTLTCNLGTLAPGASAAFSVQVLVGAGASGTLKNVASVASDTGEINPADNTVVADTVVQSKANLHLSKTCKPDGSTQAGTSALCQILVDNLGPSDAQGVSVIDQIVSNAPFTITSIEVDTGGSCSPSAPVGPTTQATLNCNLGVEPAGGRSIITVRFTSETGGDVNDTATVSSSTEDPDPSNNMATGKVSFTGLADLALTKTSSPEPVVAGTYLTYTATVTNNGPSPATNVVVYDTLPGEIEVVSVAPSVGSCTGGIPGEPAQPMACTLGTLAVGASATISMTVKVKPGTPHGFILVNNAKVASDVADLNNENNSATALTDVVAHADVSIVKTSTADFYKPSTVIPYTITVHNNGSSDAKDVIVTDNLPTNRQALYLSDTGGCVMSGLTLTCKLGDLPAGSTRSFNLYMTVKGSRGEVINTASVASATIDPLSTNNTSVRTVTIRGK